MIFTSMFFWKVHLCKSKTSIQIKFYKDFDVLIASPIISIMNRYFG